MVNVEIKDFIKKPNVYFLISFVAALLWILVVGVFLLPKSVNNRVEAIEDYNEINQLCGEIYKLDPARIDYASSKANAGKFNYTLVIDEVAGKWDIRPDEFDLSTQKPRKNRGRTTQSATLIIKQVSVSDFAGFFTEILDRWPDLKCENLKLTADSKVPDTWKISVKFEYGTNN